MKAACQLHSIQNHFKTLKVSYIAIYVEVCAVLCIVSYYYTLYAALQCVVRCCHVFSYHDNLIKVPIFVLHEEEKSFTFPSVYILYHYSVVSLRQQTIWRQSFIRQSVIYTFLLLLSISLFSVICTSFVVIHWKASPWTENAF